MKKILSAVIGVIVTICAFAQNYPFPMNEQGYEYPYGISASNPRNDNIQKKFTQWEKDLYTESGEYGRIKFDDTQYTVSEGIAYGMLIYVYMANETNTQCQDHFDKLYAYYKKWSDGNGLMHWKIKGFSSVDGSGAATDADLDVAFALCLAAKQWEKSSKYDYATEAKLIMDKVYNHEVGKHNGLKVFKPGDGWDNQSNPCYFTVASVGVFKQAQEDLGFSSTKDWETVYDDSHTYLEKSQRNGVWPNWADWSTNYAPAKRSWGDDTDYDFGWDACRVPWRVAWDYVWFGNESSKDMMAKTIELLDYKKWQNSPKSVGYFTGLRESGYGKISIPNDQSYSAGNVAWTGSVACAFMTDDARQDNLDTYYNQNVNTVGGPYYAQTIQILYMLTMSGNAANFYDCNGGSTVVTPPVVSAATTDGKAITLTCSKKMVSSTDYSGFTVYLNGAAQSNVISSMSVSGNTITLNLKNITVESGDAVAISYNDTYLTSEQGAALGSVVKTTVKNNVPGGSTILADCETTTCILGGSWYTFDDNSSKAASVITPTKNTDMLVSGGQVGSAVKVSYTLNKGSYQYDPFVGFGFNLLDGDDETPYDCTGATGISFYHKGTSVTFQVKVPGTGSNYHCYTIPAHNSWTLVTVIWNDLEQEPYWGTTVDFSPKDIFGLQWQVKGSTGQTGDIWIDEVTLIGKTISVASVDKSKLEATLATANSLYGTATIATYPQSAITTFYTAIDNAATVNMNQKATQTEIDDANTALTKAIAEFKATEVKVVDKSSLNKAIVKANDLKNNSVVGDENGEYPQTAMDALIAAIEVAQQKYDDATLTEEQVAEAVKDLNAAITTFSGSVNSLADKTDLKKYIDLSDEILANSVVGTLNGQYSETKRTALENKLNTAKKQYEKYDASQSIIDMAVSNLQQAYKDYLASKVVTAVEDVELVVSVYPNPCENILNIESSKEIYFVNIMGLSATKVKHEVNQMSAEIEVSNLAKGMYIIQIVFADGSIKTTKIVKK
ncbi:MAG: glycosyl hydrolase family 8 [Bacteroidales bacterium]|nr:glycosyl hydrolase family 8 [Bacteroidales bacterium]